MRTFFEDIKTIIGELIGLIGGLFWAVHSHWEEEPLILVIGSGAAFLFSIVLVVFKEKKKAELPPAPNINYSNENRNSTFTDIDPKKIGEQISSAPLFQQEAVANHFVGIHVRWTLKLFQILTDSNNKIFVVMNPIDETYMDIDFFTDIDKYPILKIANRGDRFEVSGKITKCVKYRIDLELTTLKEVQPPMK